MSSIYQKLTNWKDTRLSHPLSIDPSFEQLLLPDENSLWPFPTSYLVIGSESWRRMSYCFPALQQLCEDACDAAEDDTDNVGEAAAAGDDGDDLTRQCHENDEQTMERLTSLHLLSFTVQT